MCSDGSSRFRPKTHFVFADYRCAMAFGLQERNVFVVER
jgi:hypothetical protein